jgi:hypothetical protein
VLVDALLGVLLTGLAASVTFRLQAEGCRVRAAAAAFTQLAAGVRGLLVREALAERSLLNHDGVSGPDRRTVEIALAGRVFLVDIRKEVVHPCPRLIVWHAIARPQTGQAPLPGPPLELVAAVLDPHVPREDTP